MVSTHFELGPNKLDDIKRNLMLEDCVIRSHVIKVKTPFEKIHGKNYRNPYLNPGEEPAKLQG